MPKVLILTNHRKNRSPGQRFRFEQYLDYLGKNDFDITFSFLLNEKDDYYFYSNRGIINKATILIKSFIKRLAEIKTYNQYDIIFIYREAFFTGSTYFERKAVLSKAKIVFDFDDSIWLHDVSEANKKWAWLKNSNKTKEIIQLADLVIVGNQYLLDYAKKINQNVKIIPTTINTNYHVPIKNSSNTICIGWTGSSTTLKYFEEIIPFLIKIKKTFKENVTFKVIVDTKKEYPELNIKTTPWSLDTEMKELQQIHIGIMPLPDNKWTQGKCGFKGLQYMALEIPTIMSPVGVNKEIINNNVNGFLAKTQEEWVEYLSKLIESKDLRENIGKNARQTIINYYSVESQKEKYLSEFQKLLK